MKVQTSAPDLVDKATYLASTRHRATTQAWERYAVPMDITAMKAHTAPISTAATTVIQSKSAAQILC